MGSHCILLAGFTRSMPYPTGMIKALKTSRVSDIEVGSDWIVTGSFVVAVVVVVAVGFLPS